MIIATSITESYLAKSMPFFTSVNEHWHDRKICFTIGFTATIEGWECIKTESSECPWRPLNREGYGSLQHGEFIKYLPQPETVTDRVSDKDIAPDEMILFIDSDMVMQRKWDLFTSSTRAVAVTASSWPQQTLWDVICNLGVTHKKRKALAKDYMIHEKSLEFCTGFILASLDQWENIYHGCKRNYAFLDNFTHHAAWQLLINIVILNTCPSVKLLPEHVVNATWYSGTRATTNKEGLLSVTMMGTQKNESDVSEIVSDEVVYFNHTKFN